MGKNSLRSFKSGCYNVIIALLVLWLMVPVALLVLFYYTGTIPVLFGSPDYRLSALRDGVRRFPLSYPHEITERDGAVVLSAWKDYSAEGGDGSVDTQSRQIIGAVFTNGCVMAECGITNNSETDIRYYIFSFRFKGAYMLGFSEKGEWQKECVKLGVSDICLQQMSLENWHCFWRDGWVSKYAKELIICGIMSTMLVTGLLIQRKLKNKLKTSSAVTQVALNLFLILIIATSGCIILHTAVIVSNYFALR